ncbi:hypothetical protein ACIP9H_24850 [Streptomyces sp. NPDC088732]|uniref:hypothetical protein n=1 Tax=Streptomyces sp. NPDC088732 TaxID=3365879 RepID=UPI00381AA077
MYAGSASPLGVACGPLTGAVLGARLGFPAMVGVLAAALLAAAGSPRIAVAVRRRNAAAVAARPELGRAA